VTQTPISPRRLARTARSTCRSRTANADGRAAWFLLEQHAAAVDNLLTTRPTTFAGVIAALRYVSQGRFENHPKDGILLNVRKITSKLVNSCKLRLTRWTNRLDLLGVCCNEKDRLARILQMSWTNSEYQTNRLIDRLRCQASRDCQSSRDPSLSPKANRILCLPREGDFDIYLRILRISLLRRVIQSGCS
jgi:hypothetical protein